MNSILRTGGLSNLRSRIQRDPYIVADDLDATRPRSRSMIGVVLAAGEGRRMSPLSKDRPKAILPTLDVPQLALALGHLSKAGVSSAWVNSHFGTDAIREVVETTGIRLGMRVDLSHEKDRPLGTAGALANISQHLAETFVVINADVACDLSIERIAEAHRSAGGPATVLVVPAEDDADFAIDEGWVIELIDRTETLRAGYRYGGIAVFEPEVLDYIPDGESGLYETVLTGLKQDGKRIAALVWQDYWRDVGTPAAHLAANLDALAGEFDVEIDEIAGAPPHRRDALAFVGAGAEVEDVVLRHAVVGHGARVAPGTRLERCVVWDGANVKRGEYRDSILTGRRVVKAG